MSEYPLRPLVDYAEGYIDLLLSRWRKPRREAVLAALLAESQEFEGAAYEVLTGFDLDTAVGAQLDALGKLLCTRRDGRTDAAYRLRLRVEILILRSRGTPDDLVVIAQTASQGAVRLMEYDHATTLIELRDPTTVGVAVEILGFLRRSKSIGTRVMLGYTYYDDAHTFTLSPDGTVVSGDPNRGFGDAGDVNVGGFLSGVIS